MSVTIVTIGKRGQITLPVAIRKEINVHPGDQIVFVLKGRNLVIQPLTSTLLELRGSVEVTGPQDFSAIRKKVIASRSVKAASNGS